MGTFLLPCFIMQKYFNPLAPANEHQALKD